ncbi:MAG: nucleotidyltransferase family protein [Elusimicrobia bacterium]|nr:nucleotidyltransferase family protein [Elusimicrobiota bacterium]
MENGITAVIIGGGQSESLQADGRSVPKSLAPVAGKPLLEHQLDWLKRAGIDSAVLCLDFQPELVRARFGDGSAFGVRLRYSVTQEPRGSAGLVKGLGPASLPDDVLVLFGGIFPQTDCARMVRFHRGHSGLASLVLHECRPDQRAGAESCAGQGRRCARTHGCSGEPVVLGPAQRIVEFPRYAAPGQACLALSPLWVIRRALFHFVPDGAASDFVKDVFPAAVKAGESLLGYPETGLLADLGSPERYERFVKSLGKGRGPRETAHGQA